MEIYVNDILVPFAGSISIKYSNPIFNTIGSYSLPVSFPARSPLVRRAFGFPETLEASKLTSIPGLLKFAEIELIGEWEINDISDSTIEAYFKGGSSGFYGLIAGKNLTDLTYNGITLPAGTNFTEDVLAYMTSVVTSDSIYPDSDYTSYCAYMPLAAGEDTPEDYKFVNPLSVDVFGFKIPESGFGNLNQGVYLYVGAVINYIFAEFGYKINKNIFATDPDLRRLTLFNTFDQHGWGEFDYRNFVPRRSIASFLELIASRLNIAIVVSDTSRSVIIDFFDNIVATLENSNLKIINKKADKRGPSGIKLKAEQPDDFAKTNYEQELDFTNYPNAIYRVNTIRDIDGSLGDVYYVINEMTYYIIKDSGVSRICSKQFPYSVGTNATSKDLAAGSPGMYTLRKTETITGLEIERDWLLPRTDLKANGKTIMQQWMVQGQPGYNDFPIMLVFYHGIFYNVPTDPVYSELGGNYPLASTSVYNCEGDTIWNSLPGSRLISLVWDEETGLVENFWKNRLKWEMEVRRIVTGDITGSNIRKLFDFSRALTIENSNYLVNSFNVEFSGSDIKIQNAELYRL